MITGWQSTTRLAVGSSAQVRIQKNLRAKLDDLGAVAARPIKSFLLESLCWNVPDHCYGHRSYFEDFEHVMRWIYEQTQSDLQAAGLFEVNGIKRLFGDHNSWTRLQVRTYIENRLGTYALILRRSMGWRICRRLEFSPSMGEARTGSLFARRARTARSASRWRTVSEIVHLIYGTSTGAIIAALIGLNWRVAAITEQYLAIIPHVMSRTSAATRRWRRRAMLDSYSPVKSSMCSAR